MSASNPLTPSFRYPAKLPEEAAHPLVRKAIENNTSALVDLNQAVVALNSKVSTNATTVMSTIESITAATASITSNVASFNSSTGAVTFFPNLGVVNNQLGVTSYITQSQDNGAKIIVGDSSAVAITLNYAVGAPWFAIIDNDSSATATLTSTQGAIYGESSIPGGGFGIVFFDGVSWWCGATAAPSSSGVSQIIAGTGITITPSGGTGAVTVNATGGGSGTILTGTCTIAVASGGGATSGTTTIAGISSTSVLVCSLQTQIPFSGGGLSGTLPAIAGMYAFFTSGSSCTVNATVPAPPGGTSYTAGNYTVNIRAIL